MKKFIILLFTIMLYYSSDAQLAMVAENTDYTVDFDSRLDGVNNNTFDGSGFTSVPGPGLIDSDGLIATGISGGPLAFGGTNTSGFYARGTSTGGVNTGGIYAFDIGGGDIAFGVQPSGSAFLPGTFVLKVKNNSGVAFQKLSVSYDIYVYNDQDRANSFNFAHSGDNSTYTDEASLDYISPLSADSPASWIKVSRSIEFTVSVAIGADYYLQWNSADAGGSGSRDEFAIDNITVNGSSTPLPVRYLSFDASGTDVVKLNWKTSMELDNSHFEVQRSRNGHDFSTIGKVEGQLTTNRISSYNFIDKLPAPGINYYRLKQVDTDGTYDYSPIRKSYNNVSTNSSISFYPSPVNSELHVQLTDEMNTENIQIIDMTGKVVERINTQQDQLEYRIDVHHLNSGIYFIRVGETISKMIKS